MIKIAIDVNKAVLDDITTSTFKLNIAKVLELFVEEYNNKICVIIKTNFFSFNFLDFSHNVHYHFL